MLNICIVFAQLERETIQKRVTDVYYSQCLKGFHMSGQAPYGFQLEPTTVEGIRTKMMVPDPAVVNDAADFAGTNGCLESYGIELVPTFNKMYSRSLFVPDFVR